METTTKGQNSTLIQIDYSPLMDRSLSDPHVTPDFSGSPSPAPYSPSTIAELFSAGAPADSGWIRVDVALAKYWRLNLLVSGLVFIGVWVILRVVGAHLGDFYFTTWMNFTSISIVSVILVGVFLWLYVLIGRRVASFGYRLKSRELEVSSGILFQKLVSVPFARMQLVEVTAGPFERLFGIAGVQLHTASASTNAKIPGLTPERAAALRDALNNPANNPAENPGNNPAGDPPELAGL